MTNLPQTDPVDHSVGSASSLSFFELEQQLTQCFIVLGHQLRDDNAAEAMHEFQQSLNRFITHTRFEQLAQWFELEPIELRMLALVYIQQIEPECLSAFIGSSWFEQGPTLSLDKLLLLAHPHDDKHVLLEADVFRSTLFQYALIQQVEQRPTMSTPCFLAHFLVDFLSCGTASPLTDSIFALRAPYDIDPVFHACFHGTRHTQDPTKRHHQFEQLVDVDDADALWYAEQRALQAKQLFYVSQAKVEHQYTNRQLLNWLAHLLVASEGEPLVIWWPTFAGLLNWDHSPFIHALQCHPHIHLVFSAPESGRHLPLVEVAELSIDTPTLAHITHAWLALAPHAQQSDQHHAKQLAERYPVSLHRMAALVDVAIGESKGDGGYWAALQQACLHEQSRHCDGLAQLSHAQYVLSDMVLPAHVREPLNELVARVQYQTDLAQRLPRFDRGAKALFWGKPGTGKSMAAEAIAGELSLPLYKVNLANIASKWIGETEKHLASLFDSAQKYNAVLMFDEADAIFAKRSDVESSHDKNANMGVSYLLQRMEHYDGLLLLSTNFKSNLDDAFLRRFQSVIEFTAPGKAERLAIWQRALADNGDAVLMRDLGELAERFEISAAQILNIASAALLLSLMCERPAISKQDIAKALQRELSKQHAGFMAQQEMNQWLKGDDHGTNLIT